MTRIIAFLILVAVVALGGAWLMERPGEVVVTWSGWRISTSVTVGLVALVSLVIVCVLIWSVIRGILRSPRRIGEYMQERRKLRGWRAVSRGLIAVGTGNAMLAKKSAEEAKKLLGREPLTLLLAAQASQLSGHARAADAEFRKMLARPETRLLGLRGLYVEARRRADPMAAREFAEEAARLDPALLWASEALMEFQCRSGDWSGALETLERQVAAKIVGKAAARRKRGVLLTAQALTFEDTDPARARELANEAIRLAPDLVPAVALAARLMGAENLRRAARIIEKAWAANPHPELAEVYADLRPGDSASERLQRVRSLAQRKPEHPESMLAVGRAAIEAKEFGLARDILAPLLTDPTQRVCLLMAEMEAEEGNHGKAREWTARAVRAKRDPAWVADGYVSDRWLPASPLTGKLDAFVWMVPPVAPGGPVLEQVAEQALAIAPARSEPPVEPAEIPPPDKKVADRPTRRARPRPEPVIAEPPLPDDPGPEPEPEEPPRKRFRLLEWLAGPAP